MVIDPWFFLGLFIVYSWSGGGRAGMFAAVFLGILTLVHELGHAVTARRFGCSVSIRLNLFVGWALYSSAQPLTRRRRILVSAAGPLTQLTVALVGLGVVYSVYHDKARALVETTRTGGIGLDMWIGLSWAGVVIALLNLLPLWPLDGGHIVQSLLGRWLPERRALRVAFVSTLVGIAAIAILGLMSRSGNFALLERESRRPGRAQATFVFGSLPGALWAAVRAFPAYVLTPPWFLLFFAGINTVQGLGRLNAAERGVDPRIVTARLDGPVPGAAEAADAEAGGWRQHEHPRMPRGWSASPWLLAHLATRVNDEGGVQAALAQVVAPGRRWVPPWPGSDDLTPLVAKLPSPLPIGDPGRSAFLLKVLTYRTPPEQFLDYAGRLYQSCRDPEALFIAAGGLARHGLGDEAMAWLRRAATERPDPQRVAAEPDFATLHARADFQFLLSQLRASVN